MFSKAATLRDEQQAVSPDCTLRIILVALNKKRLFFWDALRTFLHNNCE